MVYFCHQFHPYAFISLLVYLLMKFSSIDVVMSFISPIWTIAFVWSIHYFHSSMFISMPNYMWWISFINWISPMQQSTFIEYLIKRIHFNNIVTKFCHLWTIAFWSRSILSTNVISSIWYISPLKFIFELNLPCCQIWFLSTTFVSYFSPFLSQP